MIKFFKIKDSGLILVAKVDEAGNKEKRAIIGQVRELLEKQIISPIVMDPNRESWLIVPKDAEDIRDEYDSKEAAKAAACKIYA